MLFLSHWITDLLPSLILTEFKATFSFHKITTKTLKCLLYILVSHFTWLLQWFIILDMNNLVNVSHHYWMLLKLSIELKSTWAAEQNGGLPFQTMEVQEEHKSLYEPPCWNGELWKVFSRENIQKSSQALTKVHFFS